MAGDWRATTLGAVLKGGIRHGIYKPLVAFGSGSRVLKMGLQFAQDRIGPQEMARAPISAEELARFRAHEGDLLFSRTSMMSDGAGKCSLVVAHDEPFVFDGNILCGTPDTHVVDPAYIFYFFKSPAGKQSISEIIAGTQSRSLSGTSLTAVRVSCPPLPEQRAIAHILGTLDDKIEQNRLMNETLEAMARALFKSWFVDFDLVRAKAEGRDPGLTQPLADLFPDSFVDSELGEIPNGWQSGTIGSIANRVMDKVEHPADWASAPLIDLGRMPQRSIALGDWGEGVELTTAVTRFISKDTLFGAIRPYFHKAGVAPVDGVTNVSVFVLRASQPTDWPFLTMLCSMADTVHYATRVAKGTKMPVVSWPDFRNYAFPVPTSTARAAFGRAAAPALERICSNIRESRALAATRDTLLPKLISGELRVGDASRFMGIEAS